MKLSTPLSMRMNHRSKQFGNGYYRHSCSASQFSVSIKDQDHPQKTHPAGNLCIIAMSQAGHHNHHHNRFTAPFPGPPGSASARTELLDFLVQGEINRGRHDTPTIRLGTTPSGLTSAHLHHPPILFTGRMPFLPPNKQCKSTENKH